MTKFIKVFGDNIVSTNNLLVSKRLRDEKEFLLEIFVEEGSFTKKYDTKEERDAEFDRIEKLLMGDK